MAFSRFNQAIKVAWFLPTNVLVHDQYDGGIDRFRAAANLLPPSTDPLIAVIVPYQMLQGLGADISLALSFCALFKDANSNIENAVFFSDNGIEGLKQQLLATNPISHSSYNIVIFPSTISELSSLRSQAPALLRQTMEGKINTNKRILPLNVSLQVPMQVPMNESESKCSFYAKRGIGALLGAGLGYFKSSAYVASISTPGIPTMVAGMSAGFFIFVCAAVSAAVVLLLFLALRRFLPPLACNYSFERTIEDEERPLIRYRG